MVSATDAPVVKGDESVAKTVGLIGLGCAKNRVDGEVMLGLQQAGYEVAANPEQADTIIIHTCGFIGAAKEESIDTILAAAEWRKQGKRLVVTGCWYNATSRICAKKSRNRCLHGDRRLHTASSRCATP